MGCSHSTSAVLEANAKSPAEEDKYDEEILAQIEKAWPAYYNKECAVSKEMLGPLKEDWKKVVSGDTDKFKAAHSKDSTITPVTYFWALFWDKANEDADLKRYFTTMNLKAKGLANILTTIIKILSLGTEAERKTVLVNLATWHNSDEMHVREAHFCNLGGTLIYALSNFLDVWDDATQSRWVNAYSYLLKHMLPVIVAYRVRVNRSGKDIDGNILTKSADAPALIGPVPDALATRGDVDLVGALE